VKFLRILRSFFPPLRTAFRWTDALPLGIFLVLYGHLILLLDAAQVLPARVASALPGWLSRGLSWCEVVLFTRPAAFWLISVAIWFWWMHLNGYCGLNRSRGLMALVVRLSLVGLFVALIAEPRAVRTSDTLSVVYALDISDSIGKSQTDKAAEFIARTVREKPETDEAGLITFGSNAAVELPPRVTFPLEGDNLVLNSRINRDATNIEQSLSLASAMLPDETRGRIVLISDGSETAGNLRQVIKELKSREITVDVLPISYSYKEEVWVERLELPQFVKIGENYEASVVLSSLQAGKGKVVLEENGQQYAEVDVEYQPGKNRIDIPIYLRAPGYYEYKATVRPADGADHLQENNEAVSYIYVEGEGKALLVKDPLGNEADHQALAQAIRDGERAVEVVDAYDFPRDALSLMPYDCVIFCNAPHDAFDSVQLQALHDAVYNQGVGFLMVGGENSFGPGGYHRSVVEDVLPVSMDITKKKILPKGALAVILHTCEFPEGNTWAKRITKQAIKVLGTQDEVGVIDYEGSEKWVFELTPAGEYEKLVPLINSASPGDMPAFGPTMQLGLDALAKSDAATRHMIIISDGDPQPPDPPLVNDFIKEKVSISMVAIFPHGGQEVSKMRAIASVTGGRYYFPADPNELPSIFIKEAKTLKRSMIQNEEIFPRAGLDASQVLEGIDAVPSLQGYVLTTLKESGPVENIMYTVPKDATEGETDPVLAVWRYGLGVTAAFTSDLSPNWGANWVNWDKYQAFVKQLLIRVSRVRKEGHLKMWSYTSGSEGVVMVEDFHPEESFLDVVAQVAGPRDQTETLQLKQVGPRRYQATFPLWGKGRYQVVSLGKGGEREDRAFGGFIVSYSPEYINFRSNWNVLREIQSETGGQMLEIDAPAASLFDRREPKSSSQPIFDWFLVALACLVPLDVAVRRVQLDWYSIKTLLGFDKRGETTQTMGALLARKKDVSATLQRRAETPLQSLQATTALIREQQARRTAAPRPKPAPGGQTGRKPPAGGEQTTTSRLLDLKRKRQQEGEEK
jgi:uncharacterized membrane protein